MLSPDKHTYVCVSGGKNRSFFEKFGVLCFLKTPVLRFALLRYYQRYNLEYSTTTSYFHFLIVCMFVLYAF